MTLLHFLGRPHTYRCGPQLPPTPARLLGRPSLPGGGWPCPRRRKRPARGPPREGHRPQAGSKKRR